MALSLLNKTIRGAHHVYHTWKTGRHIANLLIKRNTWQSESFDFESFKKQTINFINSMQTDSSGIHYRYSKSCTNPTLYASAYACMTLSLLGEMQSYSDAQKRVWADYFDSFQQTDGLFYDPVIMNDRFPDTDWWGARHLALHMISAYTDIGARPKNQFIFLQKYYDLDKTESWLNSFNWEDEAFDHTNDIDNKLMNICCLLQYQRDNFGDNYAAKTIIFIRNYLYDKVNIKTGMWGNYNTRDPIQRSRMVQFAYHLFSIFFYDDDYRFNIKLIIEHALKTQNKYGGFGVHENSSACDDIDSIDILIRLYKFASEPQKHDIDIALKKALKWVFINQVHDGGFVFRLNEKMNYGHHEMSSSINCGAMFPTWFRVLSIAYMLKSKHPEFIINRTPGLVF